MILAFGKYKGTSIEVVPFDYLVWLYSKHSDEYINNIADKEIRRRKKLKIDNGTKLATNDYGFDSLQMKSPGLDNNEDKDYDFYDSSNLKKFYSRYTNVIDSSNSTIVIHCKTEITTKHVLNALNYCHEHHVDLDA